MMNRHSFWCDVSKNNPCDCGFEYIKQSQALIKQFTAINPCHNNLYCTFCGASIESQWSESTEHGRECIYLKFHNFLEQHNVTQVFGCYYSLPCAVDYL